MKTNKSPYPADTSKQAFDKQIAILQRMDIAERAEMTFKLCDNLRAIVESGVRHRHPNYHDHQVKQAVMRLTLGDQLYQQTFGALDIKT